MTNEKFKPPDETRLKIEGICFLVTGAIAGLAGGAIPIWYVHTHLDSFFNTWFLAGPIIFDLVVIFFSIGFIAAWMFIWYRTRRFLEDLHNKKH